MRKGLLGSLVALLLGGSVGIGQAQTVVIKSDGPEATGQKAPAPATPPTPISEAFTANGPATPLTWGGASYLLWRFTNAPLPVPLVTTSSAADAGIIGNPSTQVLIGNGSYSAGWQSGYRLTVGSWVNDERLIGIEGSGFYFTPRTPTNFAGSTIDPTKVLAIPFINATPGGTSGFVAANPNTGGIGAGFVRTTNGESAILLSGAGNTGAAVVTSTTNLWGAELNGVLSLSRTENTQFNFLVGFRYVDLLENLTLDSQSVPLNVGPLYTATFHDHFGTRNQMYTGQLGLKSEWSNGTIFVNAVGKVALGVNHETVDINGRFADPLPVFIRAFGAGNTGGLFTGLTNTGTQRHSRFVVIPDVGIQAGINVTRNVRLVTGYDAMYLSNVVRPGNQIDRNINLTQVGSGAGGVGGAIAALVGPANPAPMFNQSSFWAQGVNFGLELKY